tara:strand:- start:2042 stop:4918 length:2877 start_codon:yes stop_codon:yes gene_type:complete
MGTELRMVILAGKKPEERLFSELSGDMTVTVYRYAQLSRGVRKLEEMEPDIVLLIPDSDDTSWPRAINRICQEHDTCPVFIGSDDQEQQKALESGAFEVFSREEITQGDMQRLIRNVVRQRDLEGHLKQQQKLFEWVEKTARIGTWQMDFGHMPRWSKGVRRILNDDGRLTDFASARQFVLPEDREIYDQANKATLEQGWPLDFEYRIQDPEGNLKYLHLHRRVTHDPDGTMTGAYGMVRDVTPEREFENYLFRRDAILQVVGAFAEKFLREGEWHKGTDEALKALGKATEVSRVFIFQLESETDSPAMVSMTHEWTAENVTPIIGQPEMHRQTFSPTFDRWHGVLSRRKVVAGKIRSFQSTEREFFERTEAKSILLMPVFVADKWWGFIGLSEHEEERDWLPVEIESMTMVADMFGAAILRNRMESQLKEANRSAEIAKTMAMEASQSKSTFLANMSHEIRTPISGILGMAEMTITTGLNEEQREHIDMIRDAARSLLAIINDVLDISKIEAHKLELKPEDFEIRPLVERTVRQFAPMTEKKPVSLNHMVSGAVPNMVHGDPDRLGQILRNLISNAMKFTERGFVDVTVEVMEKREDAICLLFKVQDSGEGIPEDMLGTVFESFTQVDSSVRKKHQGTGLGLTISKEFVEMMGGTIHVESEYGSGSTFSFTVCLGVSQNKATPHVTSTSSIPTGMHLNILLAEDNLLNQKFLVHFLTMFGHNVIVAENGVAVLETLKRQGHDIDLILMDIQMPEMGGIEATGIIRKHTGKEFKSDIPIIALTAYAMKGDKDRMFAAGMDDYVSKPVDMKELSAAIARAVAGKTTKQGSGPAMPSGATPKRDAAPVVTLDLESLTNRFDGNQSLLKEILTLFLVEADNHMENLDASLESANLEDLGAVLHSITNIASHVLAMDIVETSRQLEKRCYHETFEQVEPEIRKLRPRIQALAKVVGETLDTL